MYVIQSEASKHIKKLVREQKRTPSRRYHRRNPSPASYGSYANRNPARPSDLRPCNWPSSYHPIQKTETPDNKSRGYPPADLLDSDDFSESEPFDYSPSNNRYEHQTSPVQVRSNSPARQNDLNRNKEPNASSSQSIAQMQQLTTSFQEMNTKEAERYNINPNQCTEALPILNDVSKNITYL